MPTKDDILDNIKEYTIPQLAEYIHQGIIDRKDLSALPSFAASKRKELDVILAQSSSTKEEVPTSSVDDEEEWQKAQSLNTIGSYSKYLEITDNGNHTDEARQKIVELKAITSQHPDAVKKQYGKTDFEKLIDKLSDRQGPGDIEAFKLITDYTYTIKNGVDSILGELRTNPNLLSARTIKKLYDNNIFSSEQLESIFPLDFLNAMGDGVIADSPVVQPTQIDNISSPCTEVYFWGISKSGKSCMLAALLSVAKSGEFGTWKPLDCKGYEYMTLLADLMSTDKVTPVAPGTAIGTTYDMSFQFTTEDNKKNIFGKNHTKSYNHPITFIDLAGGMLDLMYKFIANKDSLLDKNKEDLMNLTQIIGGNRGINRKIHFFVIEYGAEKFKSQEKVKQDALLTNAAKYIEDERIFDKDTDAIYFVITKADKVGKHGDDLSEELKSYINSYYKGFYGRLRKICRDNEITFGIMPFSIGEVKMQSYCKLNPKPAIAVLEKIMGRTFSIDESRIGKIKKGLTQ